MNTPKIFISSTIYDLIDIRGSVRHCLEDFSCTVYASEFPDFPVDRNLHSYNVCIENLKKCDLIILIINERYGGLYSKIEESVISITRQEIKEAFNSGKTIWTFVNKKTFDSKDIFKKLCKLNPNLDKSKVFDKFKENTNSQIENHFVFEFIDEITRLPKNNWIFQYIDNYELLSTLRTQFNNFLMLDYKQPLKIEIADYKELIYKSEAYIESNSIVFSTLINDLSSTNEIIKGRAIIKLKDIEETNKPLFLSRYFSQAIENKKKSDFIFITDTTMEFCDPKVWISSSFHNKILHVNKELANRHGYNEDNYFRVIVLFNLNKSINDTNWLNSLKFLINFHKSNNIKLGFCLRESIPLYDFRDNLLNYYLVSNKIVSFWDTNTNMTFEFTKKSFPNILKKYIILSEEIIDKLSSEKGGFWSNKNLTELEIINKLKQLILKYYST
jgi:hypothetical protein